MAAAGESVTFTEPGSGARESGKSERNPLACNPSLPSAGV